jgi:hypothetical protein
MAPSGVTSLSRQTGETPPQQPPWPPGTTASPGKVRVATAGHDHMPVTISMHRRYGHGRTLPPPSTVMTTEQSRGIAVTWRPSGRGRGWPARSSGRYVRQPRPCVQSSRFLGSTPATFPPRHARPGPCDWGRGGRVLCLNLRSERSGDRWVYGSGESGHYRLSTPQECRNDQVFARVGGPGKCSPAWLPVRFEAPAGGSLAPPEKED